MSQDKRISTEYNGQTFVDPNSGLRHFRASNPAEPGDGYAPQTEAFLDNLADNMAELDQMERDEQSADADDEATGRLLAAIEKAISYLEFGRPGDAERTLKFAVNSYRVHLTRLSPPAHLVAK